MLLFLEVSLNCHVTIFVGKRLLLITSKQKIHLYPPTEVSLGFDTVSSKSETMQYVSILSTLEMLLNHENVLCEVTNPKKFRPNIYERFSDGDVFKGSNFWNETESMKLGTILYQDAFNVVNPLRNKTSKYLVSAIYMLGNLPAKHRFYLIDIHLVSLVPALFYAKYG